MSLLQGRMQAPFQPRLPLPLMFSIIRETLQTSRSSHLFRVSKHYAEATALSPCAYVVHSRKQEPVCSASIFLMYFCCSRTPNSFTVVQTGWTSLLYFLPFEFIIGSRWKGWAFDDLTHFFSAEAKVVYGPHVGKLHHFDLKTEDNMRFRVMLIHHGHLKGKTWKLGSFTESLAWQITPKHKTTVSGKGWQ